MKVPEECWPNFGSFGKLSSLSHRFARLACSGLDALERNSSWENYRLQRVLSLWSALAFGFQGALLQPMIAGSFDGQVGYRRRLAVLDSHEDETGRI